MSTSSIKRSFQAHMTMAVKCKMFGYMMYSLIKGLWNSLLVAWSKLCHLHFMHVTCTLGRSHKKQITCIQHIHSFIHFTQLLCKFSVLHFNCQQLAANLLTSTCIHILHLPHYDLPSLHCFAELKIKNLKKTRIKL
jgi:hypothetical protein